jgi:endothelial-specific receptor tyrosine kinase
MYGVNCEQHCPEGCRLKSCDIYTGICNKGECITESYIAPDCKESKSKNQNSIQC